MEPAVLGLVGTVVGALIAALAAFLTRRSLREDFATSAVAPLIQARLAPYQSLWQLTEYGPEGNPKQLSPKEVEEFRKRLLHWYYRSGGLLLSHGAGLQFRKVIAVLYAPGSDAEDIWSALSVLRTRLKNDVMVRAGEFLAAVTISPKKGPPGTRVLVRARGIRQPIKKVRVSVDGRDGEEVSVRWRRASLSATVPLDARPGRHSFILTTQLPLGHESVGGDQFWVEGALSAEGSNDAL